MVHSQKNNFFFATTYQSTNLFFSYKLANVIPNIFYRVIALWQYLEIKRKKYQILFHTKYLEKQEFFLIHKNVELNIKS